MADTFREALRESLAEANAGGAVSGSVESDVAPAASADTDSSSSVEPSGVAESAGASSTGDGQPGPVVGREGRARDAAGKFVKAETSPTPITKAQAKGVSTPAPKQGEATQTTPPVTGQPSQTPQPKYKAPQSWSPTAREHWAAMNEAAQAEVDRREKEIAKALQDAAKPREFHQAFQQVISPYLGMIQAEGSDPLKAVGNLLQTAAALRTAPPAHKAQLVASLVQQFGVPIEALDAALAGQAPPPGQPQHFDPSQFIQQAKQEFAREIAQHRQQALLQTAQQEAQTFAEKAEFFEDVREDVAEILDVAARRGRAMTLEEAYSRAVALHPDISKVLKQREAAEAAKAQQASTQRAKAAATSVKSEPTGLAPSRESGSYRDELRQQFAERNRG